MTRNTSTRRTISRCQIGSDSSTESVARASWRCSSWRWCYSTDQAYLRTGDDLLGGGFDEAAHLLTGALVLAALPRAPRRGFAFGTLTMSVLIDVDHVPGLLGIDFITRGTDRPYSHSLATLALLGLGSIAWRSGRSVLAGVLSGPAL